jgi:hypothetical protein
MSTVPATSRQQRSSGGNVANRLAAIALLATLALVHPDAQAQTGSDPWFRYSTKPKDFQAAKLPWNTFSIELPKNWQLVPGYGGMFFIAVEKTRNNQATAAVILEQMHLVEPLGPADVDSVLGKLEADAALYRDPSGKNLEQQIKQVGAQRFVFLQYTRPGHNGTDRVVMYAIPAGRIMYRLVCIAPADQLEAKYQEIFAHVAASFKRMGANSD